MNKNVWLLSDAIKWKETCVWYPLLTVLLPNNSKLREFVGERFTTTKVTLSKLINLTVIRTVILQWYFKKMWYF